MSSSECACQEKQQQKWFHAHKVRKARTARAKLSEVSKSVSSSAKMSRKRALHPFAKILVCAFKRMLFSCAFARVTRACSLYPCPQVLFHKDGHDLKAELRVKRAWKYKTVQ